MGWIEFTLSEKAEDSVRTLTPLEWRGGCILRPANLCKCAACFAVNLRGCGGYCCLRHYRRVRCICQPTHIRASPGSLQHLRVGALLGLLKRSSFGGHHHHSHISSSSVRSAGATLRSLQPALNHFSPLPLPAVPAPAWASPGVTRVGLREAPLAADLMLQTFPHACFKRRPQ